MSRQAQNILTGAIACAVAAIAVVTVALAMARDSEQVATAPVAPLTSDASQVDAVDTGNAVPPRTIPASPTALAVTAGQPADSSTTVVAETSTTATTVGTTAATAATTAPAETTVTTAAESGSSSSVQDGSPTTDGSSSSTAATTTTSSNGSSTTKASVGQTTTTAEGTTTTTAATTTTSASTTTTTVATSTSAAPTTEAPSSGSLNAIEREIARLTNELRTNPNGPLKREGAAIDCSGRVRVDLASGQYESIGAVTVSEVASLQVARPWSAQMSRSNFEHQPNAGVGALQAAGISVRSAGENIAYHNYPDKAMFHFTGWRESDGHFCNMMNPGFTHLGIGEVTKSDGISYATQNFFSTS